MVSEDRLMVMGMGMGVGFSSPPPWTPAAVPGCILYAGAYQEARATRGAQPTLVDGDMEAATAVAYASARCALTKENTAPYAGALCLKQVGTGAGLDGFAQQSILVVGNRYLIRAAGQSSALGSMPKCRDNSGVVWFTGTNSTDWQSLSGEQTAASSAINLCCSPNTAVGEAVRWDAYSIANLSITSYTPAFTTIPGSVLAQAEPTAQPWVSSDGLGIMYQGGDFMEWTAPSSAVKCLHDGSGGTLIVAVRASVLNATNRFAVTFGGADIGTGIGVALKYTNANTIGVEVSNGSGTLDLDASGAATVAIDTTYVVTLRIASGANGVTVRQNGVNKVTGTLTAPSAANPSTGLHIGPGTNPASASLNGVAGHPFVANRVLTDAECTAVENYILAQATL